jgi:DNA modification methylase
MSYAIIQGDCLEILRHIPDNSIHCCVTSPPYFGLRDYGCDGQIGLEATPAEFVAEMVAVFHEVKRVLRDDGVCWLNLGDSYAAHEGLHFIVIWSARAEDVASFCCVLD